MICLRYHENGKKVVHIFEYHKRNKKMKKRNITITMVVTSLALSTVLLSNSSGPGGNRTGAPGAQGDCTGCHYAGKDPNGSITVKVLDNGTAISSYESGKTYDLELTLNGTSSKMGFQFTAIDANNNKAGNVSEESAGTTVYSAGKQQVWGHSTPGTSTNTNTWKAKWEAPSSGTGDVSIYMVGILANSNGTNSGDNIEKSSITLSEATTSNTTQIQKSTLRLLNNPTSETINLSRKCQSLSLWNSKGQLIQKASGTNTLDVADLNSGLYHLNAIDEKGMKKSFHVILN